MFFDAAPAGKKFGGVLVDVRTAEPPYRVGETVVAQFVGANPRVSLTFDLLKTLGILMDFLFCCTRIICDWRVRS